MTESELKLGFIWKQKEPLGCLLPCCLLIEGVEARYNMDTTNLNLMQGNQLGLTSIHIMIYTVFVRGCICYNLIT